MRRLLDIFLNLLRRQSKPPTAIEETSPPTPDFLSAPKDDAPKKHFGFSLFKRKSARAEGKPTKPIRVRTAGLVAFFKRFAPSRDQAASPRLKKSGAIFATDHWFWQPVRASWDIYRQVIVASLLINVFSLASSLYIMTVYDRIIPNKAIESLWALSLIIFIILVFDFAVKSIRSSLIDDASARVDRHVSEKLFRRITRRNMDMNRQTLTSLSNIVRDFDVLKDVIGSASFTIFVDLPFILLFIAVLFYVGGPIAIIPAAIVPLIIVFGMLMQPVLRREGLVALKQAGDKNLVVTEMVTGIETLKTIRGLDMLQNRWTNAVVNQGEAVQGTRKVGQLVQNVTQFGQQVSQIGIVIYGVFLIADRSLTMGQLIACVILSGRALAPLGNLTQLIARLDQATVAFHNLDRLMNETSHEEAASSFIKRGRLEPRLNISGLSFRHEGKPTPALSDINLSIAPNQNVALLGRIGSGKSTLLNTMAGLTNITDGQVQIGGVNMRHMRTDDLRENISIVLSNPVFFAGTIRENILMGNPEASDTDILEVADLAGAAGFINDLPDGFDFHISQDARELSSGMRQVLSIIRAIISRPGILLLDEPTTSMDAQAEKLVVDTLSRVTQNMTCVIATHRGALLEVVDRVIILEQGRIVADGPTQEMLERINAERN